MIFVQKYRQQKELSRPTEADVDKKDPEVRAFQDAVLKVKVLGVCVARWLTYEFPFSMNVSSTQLKGLFVNGSMLGD